MAGLSRYAHLINVDFFNDLLNVLNGTINIHTLPFEDALNCVATAFQICSGQGALEEVF